MAYRKEINYEKSKKIFHNTAATTKAINVSPKPLRGGVRL